jgi:hypothetical protein
MASDWSAIRSRYWQGLEPLWLDAFVAFNFLCLTGDTVLAHSENQFRNSAEYVPVCASPIAFLLVIAALAFRAKDFASRTSVALGHLAGWLAIVVGVAGVIYHLDSSFFAERTLRSLTYAAPFAAPLSYVGLGCLLLMNRMVSPRSPEWPQWIVFFAMGGFAGNFVLSLTDHAVNGFYRPTEWIPVVSSALAVGFLFAELIFRHGRGFLRLCAIVLLLQVVVGVGGFFLHLLADLNGPAGSLYHNVIHGAPPFAPLLLPNLSLLGCIGLFTLGSSHSG